MPTECPAAISSANCAGWRGPRARWAASPRASPGERMFGIKTDRAAHAEDLRTILGGLKGPLMKVAQFLSTVPDALPAEYAAELAQLQANAPADGLDLRAPPHGERTRPGLADAVRRVSARRRPPRPRSARCIARRLPDGTDVACKLQYPDMPSTVEADLRQLRLAMAIYHRMDNAIQHEEIYKELTERLREELDYEREAAQMRLYALMLAEHPGVHVPVPIAGYCTQAAADHDLARWPAADAAAGGGPAAGGAQRASPRRCSAPGTCRSTATA